MLRLDVPNPDMLELLRRRGLPFGLRASRFRRRFFRDTYYDTSDGRLAHRGVLCFVRTDSTSARRTLILRIRQTDAAGGAATYETLRLRVGEASDTDVLRGTSGVARRLQALTDPGGLEPRLDLETDRRVVNAYKGLLPLRIFEVSYDSITVVSRTTRESFYEIEYCRIRKGTPRLATVAQYYEGNVGLRAVAEERLDRAWGLIRAAESEALVRGLHTRKEVVVLASERGRIALRRVNGELLVPYGAGSGEGACRHIMREHLGSADGQVQLLGLAPATETLPVMEVWLARRLPRGLTSGEGTDLDWVPLAHVVSRVGSSELKDLRTLAAIGVAARSGVLTELPVTIDTSIRMERRKAGASGATAHGAPVVEENETRQDADRPAYGYLNENLSIVAFNQRVLELAEDETVPLLERLRFAAIFASNMDEFFMVRVAGLKRAVARGKGKERTADGLTIQGQLDALAIRVRSLYGRLQVVFERCVPELEAAGISLKRWDDLTPNEQQGLGDYFKESVLPIVSPRAMTRAPGHPFPRIAGLDLSVAVMIKDPRTGPVHFSHLRIPPSLKRFVAASGGSYVLLEDVIKANAGMIYPDRTVGAVHVFRVTRAADIELDEPGAGSLLHAVEEEVGRRDFNEVVRIEVESSMPSEMRDLLLRELRFEKGSQVGRLSRVDIYEVDGMLKMSSLSELVDLVSPGRDELRFPAFEPQCPIGPEESIFERIAAGDLLVHLPYDSFDGTVGRFLIDAADDPAVEAVRMTLYRTGGRSPIVNALIKAARAGKTVDVFVEIKARFDEEQNVAWARKLSDAGVNVVYGFVEVKTHAKVALIVRKEEDGVRKYVHIGTGNYNSRTALLYSDVGLLTTDPVITADVNDLFNELTGSPEPPQQNYRKLLVAPHAMLERFLELIEAETGNAVAGEPAGIVAKVNGLTDRQIVDALYRAAHAGVKVDLMVRSMCVLRPMENITVTSVLGRFLEHARIYRFTNRGSPLYFIGSADWRPRNLRRRVEVVTPVEDEKARQRIDRILAVQLQDPTAWLLDPDGSYRRKPPAGPPGGYGNSHELFLEGVDRE